MKSKNINYADAVLAYPEVDFKFHSYYKYAFIYKGETDTEEVFISIGGNADDIYRWEISADGIDKITDFGLNSLNYITVYEKNI